MQQHIPTLGLFFRVRDISSCFQARYKRFCAGLYSDIYCNDGEEPNKGDISWDLENQFRDELPVRLSIFHENRETEAI